MDIEVVKLVAMLVMGYFHYFSHSEDTLRSDREKEGKREILFLTILSFLRCHDINRETRTKD